MTQRAELRLDLKRQASMIDDPLDELVLHRRARRPNPRRNIERVPQQADRAFGNHLRGRSIAGIAIALDRRADLAAVRADRNIKKIVTAVLAFLLGRPLARLGRIRSGLVVVGGPDALGFAPALFARSRA